MELTFQIQETTARKIQKLAKAKSLSADEVADLFSVHLDAIVTAHLVEHVKTEYGLEAADFLASEDGDSSGRVVVSQHNTEDEGETLEVSDHGLSGESEDVIDQTPAPFDALTEEPLAPPVAAPRTSDSFSSLVDQNLANADVTDDPEEYMEEMVAFQPSQAKEAKVPAPISVPLNSQPREASSRFTRPRVNISEVSHGNA